MTGLVVLSLAFARAGEFDPLSLGADLSCSACEMFMEQFLSKCSHYLYGAGKREVEGGKSVLSMYKERIFDLYEEHEPPMSKGKKKKKVEKIISREIKKGLFPARRIHELYVMICEKYEVMPEAIYEGEVAKGTETERKEVLVLVRLPPNIHFAAFRTAPCLVTTDACPCYSLLCSFLSSLLWWLLPSLPT